MEYQQCVLVALLSYVYQWQQYIIRSSCKVSDYGPILNKFGFLTSFNTRLHENPSSESLVDIRGRTDG